MGPLRVSLYYYYIFFLTTSQPYLVPRPRFERGEFLLLRETTLPDLSSGAMCMVLQRRIELRLLAYQASVLPLNYKSILAPLERFELP